MGQNVSAAQPGERSQINNDSNSNNDGLYLVKSDGDSRVCIRDSANDGYGPKLDILCPKDLDTNQDVKID